MSSIESKDPDEIITATFPFADALGDAALSSIDYVTMAVINGADPGAAAMLNGAAAIVAGDVQQSVRDGLNGVDYRMRCRAVLSDGRKLVRAITVRVRAK